MANALFREVPEEEEDDEDEIKDDEEEDDEGEEGMMTTVSEKLPLDFRQISLWLAELNDCFAFLWSKPHHTFREPDRNVKLNLH